MDSKSDQTNGNLDLAKVLLIGDEDDLLHCGNSSTIRHEGKRFPSVIHYAYAKILGLVKAQDEHILDLLSQTSVNVASKALELIQAHIHPGQDMSAIATSITSYRQMYIMEGYKLRVEQDDEFKSNLLQTNDTLLIVCDPKDSELGIGMSDTAFLEFFKAGNYEMQDLSDWLLKEPIRPKAIGQNQLGFLLMYLRYELKEADRLKILKTEEYTFQGLSSEQLDDEEKPMEITSSANVLCLTGILKPLSNYYKYTFEVKGQSYRSVEHYVYERLLDSLVADEHYFQRIRSVPQPADVKSVAEKIINELIKLGDVEEEDVKKKKLKMDRWKQTAMKNKISKDVELQRLLLNTGNSFLVESNPYGDDVWTLNTNEYELQHLLTKPKIDISTLAGYMTGKIKKTKTLEHIGMNKTGILLMELRKKYSNSQFIPYSYISAPEVNIQRMGLSNNVICFTPESIFHPFYPVKIVVSPELTVPTPIHYVVLFSCRFLGIKPEIECELMTIQDGADIWYHFNTYINYEVNLPFDKIKNYYSNERQKLLKISLSMMFQQHPAILRSLLETEDSLLVYCSRYSTIESELTSGLREKEFRRLFQKSESDVIELITIFSKPLAKRPPYIGGNRLGFILMELRRSFTLAGCYPSQYEALPMPWEAKLGTNSPTENYTCDRPFVPMKRINFVSVWAEPYILYHKTLSDYSKLIRVVPAMIGDNIKAAKRLSKELIEEKIPKQKLLKTADSGVKAVIFNALMAGLNENIISAERKVIKLKDVNISLQSINQHFEEEKTKKIPLSQPPSIPQPFPSMLGPSNNIQIKQPTQQIQPNPQIQQSMSIPQQNNQGWRDDRRSFNRDNNYRNDNRNRNDRRPFGSHQNRINLSGNRNYRSGDQRNQRRYSPIRDQDRVGDKRRTYSPKEDKKDETPKAKKPKRIVDESELSEGEILSSEED